MPFEFMMILSMLVPILVLGGGGYLALRFVRAFERRGISQKQVADLEEKIAQLAAIAESTQRDVGRLSEEQEFTTRLLSQRHENQA